MYCNKNHDQKRDLQINHRKEKNTLLGDGFMAFVTQMIIYVFSMVMSIVAYVLY